MSLPGARILAGDPRVDGRILSIGELGRLGKGAVEDREACGPVVIQGVRRRLRRRSCADTPGATTPPFPSGTARLAGRGSSGELSAKTARPRRHRVDAAASAAVTCITRKKHWVEKGLAWRVCNSTAPSRQRTERFRESGIDDLPGEPIQSSLGAH